MSRRRNKPPARPVAGVRDARLHVLGRAALLVAVTFLAYLPALNGGFIWDDELYVTRNTLIKASDGLFRFWFTTQSIDYWPLTNTSFWIEWRLWGMNPTGYHVANLLLHIASSLLIWMILRQLSIPGAYLAALLYAVHPVNVESVAWIAQRKNELSLLFFLLSILWYLKAGPGADRWYALSLSAFTLAMLSKGSVATLPLVLLLIAWWQHRRITRWDLARTAPFFLVAATLTAVNVWFQTHGANLDVRDASFTERLLGAGAVVWFYLYKALLPLNLAFIYPQWDIQPSDWRWWAPLLATVVVTVLLVCKRHAPWGRPLLLAWLFFCAALVPVMGFTDVYFMKFSLVADHYQYIALIAVVALVAALWSAWRQRTSGAARSAILGLAVLMVATLAFLARQQSKIYADIITVYQDTLRKNPTCWLAHNNLGNALAQSGRLPEAIDHIQQALQIKPDLVEAYDSLGNALVESGRLQEAIQQFQRALQLKQNFPESHYGLGIAQFKAGHPQEAIEHLQQAVRLRPAYAEAHNNLGNALAHVGRLAEAIVHYKQAVQLIPDDAAAHNNLGLALVQAHQPEEAIEQYNLALSLKPEYVEAAMNLAVAYAQTNRSAQAIATAQKALDLAGATGKTNLVQQIEKWLTAYRAGLKDSQNNPSRPEPASPSP